MDRSSKQLQTLTFAGEEMTLHFADGRRVSVPLWWYPRLRKATEEQRQAWVLSAGGKGLHWEAIDEDLSIAGILNGEKAPDAKANFLPDSRLQDYRLTS